MRELRSANRRFCAAFGSYRVAELDTASLIGYLLSLQHEGLAKKTRRKLHYFLKKIFQRAVVAKVIAHNPLVDVPTEYVPANRVRDDFDAALEVLSLADIERVLSEPSIPVPLRVFLGLVLLLGCRTSEAAAFRWGDLIQRSPLPEAIIRRAWSTADRRFKATKKERWRRVPVHPAMMVLLDLARAWFMRTFARAPRESDLVAPYLDKEHRVVCWRGPTVLKAWRDAAARLGLPRTRVHGLKHTYSTQLRRAAREQKLDPALVFVLTHAQIVGGGNDGPASYDHSTDDWDARCEVQLALKVEIRAVESTEQLVFCDWLKTEAPASGRAMQPMRGFVELDELLHRIAGAREQKEAANA